ncbi:MAG: glycosyltransferase family 2 protein [Thermoproteota archaeon]|nr:glycosyltransferase family 2 protein [Thermoproteota archaeon]
MQENILSETNARMQIHGWAQGRKQEDNNNSTGNRYPRSDAKHDTFSEKNKNTQGRVTIEKAPASRSSLFCPALSPEEQHNFVEDNLDTRICNRTAKQWSDNEHPFISLLVATHNESIVIERLLKSFTALTYPSDKFEIIIVDDSTDDTYPKLQCMLGDFQNLKVIHRDNRAGWKGGALNVGLGVMDRRASNVLVVDADNVLQTDTLERFVSRFTEKQSFYNDNQASVLAIQGFPISKSNLEEVDSARINVNQGNWISRAIDFRLAQRNMIEFAAKEILNLPVQITGSLFMIKSELVKSVKFSNDICEDWDLTLDLYCINQVSSDFAILADNNQVSYQSHKSVLYDQRAEILPRPKIIFDKELVSYCEATTDLAAYFRQRVRVSEGHTRGLRKKIRQIAGSKMLSRVDKVELFLNGLQYAKYTFVLGVGIINAVLIPVFLLGHYSSHQLMDMVEVSFSLQGANLAAFLVRITLGAKICRPVRSYGIKDILSLVALMMVTTPALVIGSVRGLLRDNGTFYRTRRNLPQEPKITQPVMS